MCLFYNSSRQLTKSGEKGSMRAKHTVEIEKTVNPLDEYGFYSYILTK